MRRFHSYGPVDPEDHFCVKREELVDRCLKQLIGNPEKGGHYFTIWAPRQTGKTWLMQEVERRIKRSYEDRFAIFRFSVGVLRELDENMDFKGKYGFPEEFGYILKKSIPSHPHITTWDEFDNIFLKETGLWDRPLLMLIDEVDSCPQAFLDVFVNRFREMYLDRSNHWLHGLALTGVRAVLGVESPKGSPFNVQRSLHVPNFSKEEVEDLFWQYQEESGQKIEDEVVNLVYEKTLGQPGLIGWLGELLTEKYNPGKDKVIGINEWEVVWLDSRSLLPNNTVMNLIAKAREDRVKPILTELFSQSSIEFEFHNPIHNYLYLNGIISSEKKTLSDNREHNICKFTSPFVQDCLYHALSTELLEPIRHNGLVNPLDDLSDVLDGPKLILPPLLDRYRAYLQLLKDKVINPWKEQPRRKQDLNLTEAVGHFHLYSWLLRALKSRCVVSPEFPTGNGKVDIHIKYGEKRGIIEVKSFLDMYTLKISKEQAADYAKQLGLDSVTLALFASFTDESLIKQLVAEDVFDDVTVYTSPIGWE